MPIYNFQCNHCGVEFEELVPRRGETAPCPDCGSDEVGKMISLPAPHQSSGSMDFGCGPEMGSGGCGCTPESCPHIRN